MKIDFKQKLMSVDGSPIVLRPESKTEDGKTTYWTLGFISVQALLGGDQKGVSGSDKYDRYVLAGKVTDNEELTIDEVATVKKLIGETFSALIVGPSWDLLEGK